MEYLLRSAVLGGRNDFNPQKQANRTQDELWSRISTLSEDFMSVLAAWRAFPKSSTLIVLLLISFSYIHLHLSRGRLCDI